MCFPWKSLPIRLYLNQCMEKNNINSGQCAQAIEISKMRLRDSYRVGRRSGDRCMFCHALYLTALPTRPQDGLSGL